MLEGPSPVRNRQRDCQDKAGNDKSEGEQHPHRVTALDFGVNSGDSHGGRLEVALMELFKTSVKPPGDGRRIDRKQRSGKRRAYTCSGGWGEILIEFYPAST